MTWDNHEDAVEQLRLVCALAGTPFIVAVAMPGDNGQTIVRSWASNCGSDRVDELSDTLDDQLTAMLMEFGGPPDE